MPLAISQWSRKYLREDLLGQFEIEFAAKIIEHRRAGSAKGIIESERNQYTDREHPQRRLCAVGNHTVVDIHGEQRQRQTQQVDQKCCYPDPSETASQFIDLTPEPVRTSAYVPGLAGIALGRRVAKYGGNPTSVHGF